MADCSQYRIIGSSGERLIKADTVKLRYAVALAVGNMDKDLVDIRKLRCSVDNGT